jgi:glycosyltransferase involved in cell wall biosynthesis
MKKRKVAIVTNIPTPYRKDFFYAIERIDDIESKVFFCNKKERSRLWNIGEMLNYTHEFVQGWRIERDNGSVTYVNIKLFRALRRFNPAVIITGGASIPSLLCVIYKKLYGCRIYIWWAGTDLSEKERSNLRRLFRKWLFGQVDGFFTYSNYSKEYLESFAITSNKITVIGNNTLESEQYGLDVRENGFRRPSTYSDGFAILVVAQLIPRKNIVTILETYLCLHKKYPDVILEIAGIGPEEQRLKDFCTENKLRNVQFLENVQPQDLKKYYAEADVLVSIALMDQWPQVVNEAMSCGVPVIASTTSGIDTYFLRDGINGYLVDPEDKETLLNRLEYLVLNPEKAKSMGQEAFRIARTYDVHYAIGRIEEALLHEDPPCP